MTVCTALCPEIELIDVRGHEVNIIDFALKCSQLIPFQQIVMDTLPEIVLVVVEIVFDVVGISLIDLCQQFRGDDTNPVMLDRY